MRKNALFPGDQVPAVRYNATAESKIKLEENAIGPQKDVRLDSFDVVRTAGRLPARSGDAK